MSLFNYSLFEIVIAAIGDYVKSGFWVLAGVLVLFVPPLLPVSFSAEKSAARVRMRHGMSGKLNRVAGITAERPSRPRDETSIFASATTRMRERTLGDPSAGVRYTPVRRKHREIP